MRLLSILGLGLLGLGLPAASQNFMHFPAVGGRAAPAPVRAARPPGTRPAAFDRQQDNEVEPAGQEPRRLSRPKGRFRSRARPAVPQQAVPDRRRVEAGRQEQPAPARPVRPEQPAPVRPVRLRVRPVTTASPASRPAQPGVGQDRTVTERTRFVMRTARPTAPPRPPTPPPTRPTPPPTRPTPPPTRPPPPPTRPPPPIRTPPPPTLSTQPAAPLHPTTAPFVFLPATAFQPRAALASFPAVPEQESRQAALPTFSAFQPEQPVQAARGPFIPRAPVQPLRAPVQAPRAPVQAPRAPVQASRASVQPPRTPVQPPRTPAQPLFTDSMFDSGSLFSSRITVPQDTGEGGVYFSYSAIL